MNKSVKYIELIADMYSLSSDVKNKLITNAALIEKEFEYYTWEDIKWAVEIYYAKKNDKTYPKLAQITAILNANGKKKDSYTAEPAKRPTTQIIAIKAIFEDVMKVLHEQGICYVDYFKHIPQGNKMVIKNGGLWNRKWDWDSAVEFAKQNFPQEFFKFKHLTKCEEYAMAYKLGCIK